MRTQELLSERSILAVKRLIVVGIVASVAHFLDNALEIGHYPEPNWITPGIVLLAWIPNGIVAIAALVWRNNDLVFATLTAIFGLLLLTGLAHYLYGSPTHISSVSNFTILFEALSGVSILVALSFALANRNS
jgi:hypothetical protein